MFRAAVSVIAPNRAMSDPTKPDVPPAEPEGDARIARRKLLQSAHYVAPAILATLVVDMKSLAPNSCSPHGCMPSPCQPFSCHPHNK
jgi:hypothetical protein